MSGAADEYATALDLLGQVDGLILLSSRIPPAGLKELARQTTPVVLVNRIERGVDLPMVAIDNFTPMMQLCGHLARLGHRRVVYLAGSDLSWQNRERWRGIEMARAFGIDAVRVASDATIEGAYAADPRRRRHSRVDGASRGLSRDFQTAARPSTAASVATRAVSAHHRSLRTSTSTRPR